MGSAKAFPSLAADAHLQKGNVHSQVFPWDDAFLFCVRVLRLSPSDFWAMTPREFFLLARPFTKTLSSRTVPDESGLVALMEMFPD